MRLPDENKRRKIVAAAADLFATHPFEQVRLDDVAQTAGVGKGTVYIYFKSKEDLYFSSVYDGFSAMVETMGRDSDHKSATQAITEIVHAMIDFATRYPQMFEVMRDFGVPAADSQWGQKRLEYFRRIEDAIRKGVTSGEFADAHPEFTALYVSSMIRGIMQYGPGPRNVDGKDLAKHITAVLLNGISNHRP